MIILKMLLCILLVGLFTFFFKLFRIADVMLYASAILIPFLYGKYLNDQKYKKIKIPTSNDRFLV